jgi:hypothetical protein
MTEHRSVSRRLPVVAAAIVVIASWDAPAIAQPGDRSAAIDSLPDHSRRFFEVPPGGTPQPWQRVPDFDRLDDVVAVVTAIGVYCAEQRRLTCARLCPVPAPPGTFDERRIPEGQRRDLRITSWRRCAGSVGEP